MSLFHVISSKECLSNNSSYEVFDAFVDYVAKSHLID